MKKVVFMIFMLVSFSLHAFGSCVKKDGGHNVDTPKLLATIDEDTSACIGGTIGGSTTKYRNDYYSLKFKVAGKLTIKATAKSLYSTPSHGFHWKINFIKTYPQDSNIVYRWIDENSSYETTIDIKAGDTLYFRPQYWSSSYSKYIINYTFIKEQESFQSDKSITLTGTLRDFRQDHPDFERPTSWEVGYYVEANGFDSKYNITSGLRSGLEKGNVLPELGADGKPVVNPDSTNNFKPIKLEEWYKDVDGVNMAMPYTIELKEIAKDVYQFSSDAFFPADNKLFGNEAYHGRTDGVYNHNYHLTYELHTNFTYKRGSDQIFNFVGDDDVWVFINNKLAVDIGGIHSAETETINLDDAAERLGLEDGKTYPLDFFWAERHTDASKFTITTSIALETEDNSEPLGCQQNAWLSKDSDLNNLYELDTVHKSESSKNIVSHTYYANALGYNRVDGFLWAYNNKDRDESLIRIGKDKDGNYISKKFGPILDINGNHVLPRNRSGQDLAAINVGDINEKGHLYMLYRENADKGLTSEKDIVYVVDLNSSSGSYLKIIDSFEIRDYNRLPTVGKGLDIVDWAFHPKNGKLYSVSNDGRFYEIDPVAKTVTKATDAHSVTVDGNFETFFDENGYLYLYRTRDGKVYRMDLTDPDNPDLNTTLFTTISDAKVSGGDSARCANAPMGDKPILAIEDATVVEGTGGDNFITFKISSDRKFDNSIDLQYTITDGSAKNGEDYIKSSAKVVQVDEHTLLLQIGIVTDTSVEPNEDFSVELQSTAAYFVLEGAKNAKGTIIDDDKEALSCDENAYMFTSIENWLTDNGTKLSLVNFDKRSIDYLATLGDAHINAAGYSVDDDFMYGIEGKKGQSHVIVKIDKNYKVVQRIPLPDSYSTESFADGDVQDSIFYFGWLKDDVNKIYRYDIQNNRFLTPVDIRSNAKVLVSDFAFNIKDKKLYGVDSKSHELVRINMDLHRIDFLGKINFVDNVNKNANNAVITFFDKDGNFYFSQKNDNDIDIYKLYIGEGSNINVNAEYYQKFTNTEGAGDGARCANAAMRPDIMLDDNLTIIEGDTGIKTLVVRVKLNKPAIKDVTFHYKTIDGSADNHDYKYAEGDGIIYKGESETIVNIQILGDLITESNEVFLIELSNIYGAHSAQEKIYGICHIVDNDHNIFDAWDPDQPNKKIQTKVVAKSFELEIAKIDRLGNIVTDGNETDTKLRIVEEQLCQIEFDGNMSDFTDFNLIELHNRLFQFQITKAYKNAKVQFYWKDDNGIVRTACSRDTFAVRPKKYLLEVPQIVPGEDFNITIKAVDFNGNVVTNYEEGPEVYDLNITERGSGCQLAETFAPQKVAFEDGKAVITTRYPDIGKLRFKVSEKRSGGTEFAHIDAMDGSGESRFIEKAADIDKTVRPAKIAFTWDLKNGDDDYTYYNNFIAHSDGDAMSAKLDLQVEVRNANDEPVKNFTAECEVAQNVAVQLKHDIVTSATLPPLVTRYSDLNASDSTVIDPQTTSIAQLTLPAVPVAGGVSSYGVDQRFFHGGKAHKLVEFNFDRNASVPLNPMRLTITEVNATLGALTETKHESKSVTFLYTRAHIPDQEFVVSKEEEQGDATVFYEMYCKGCDQSLFGLSNLKESVDAVNWYTLPHVSESYFNFDGNLGSINHIEPKPPISSQRKAVIYSLENIGGKKLRITVGKSPMTVRVKYKPKSYLVYNPFNASAQTHSFTATFLPAQTQWAGKGDLGYTVDQNISSHNRIDIIDW